MSAVKNGQLKKTNCRLVCRVNQHVSTYINIRMYSQVTIHLFWSNITDLAGDESGDRGKRKGPLEIASQRYARDIYTAVVSRVGRNRKHGDQIEFGLWPLFRFLVGCLV